MAFVMPFGVLLPRLHFRADPLLIARTLLIHMLAELLSLPDAHGEPGGAADTSRQRLAVDASPSRSERFVNVKDDSRSRLKLNAPGASPGHRIETRGVTSHVADLRHRATFSELAVAHRATCSPRSRKSAASALP